MKDEQPVAAILAVMVTVMVALAALTPYVMSIPEKNLNLITQAQTTLWNGWLMILTYYYATTNANTKAAATIATQAKTIQDAQTTLTNKDSA
jgi:uncharacterized membrane protein